MYQHEFLYKFTNDESTSDRTTIAIPFIEHTWLNELIEIEIRKSAPKIIVNDMFITHKCPSGYFFKYTGNICNIFNEIVEGMLIDKDVLPIHLGAKNSPDFSAIYITSPIIEDQIVGEGYDKVLRFITTESSQYGQIINYEDNLQYLRVEPGRLKYINICIKQDLTHHLAFNQGYVNLKLHFRRIKDE